MSVQRVAVGLGLFVLLTVQFYLVSEVRGLRVELRARASETSADEPSELDEALLHLPALVAQNRVDVDALAQAVIARMGEPSSKSRSPDPGHTPPSALPDEAAKKQQEEDELAKELIQDLRRNVLRGSRDPANWHAAGQAINELPVGYPRQRALAELFAAVNRGELQPPEEVTVLDALMSGPP